LYVAKFFSSTVKVVTKKCVFYPNIGIAQLLESKATIAATSLRAFTYYLLCMQLSIFNWHWFIHYYI